MEKQASRDEADRLSALRQYNIMESLPEREYDELTLLASTICGVETSTISFMDENRQFHKSKTGGIVGGSHTEREVSFCKHVIDQHDMMVVPDAAKDERFCNNPYVTGGTRIRFYAGVPITTSDGFVIGTFCVIDNMPHQLTVDQIKSLKILANQVMQLLELRKANSNLERLNGIADDKIIRYAHANAHEVRGPLARLLGLIELNRIDDSLDQEWFYNQIKKEARDIDEVLKLISRELERS